MFTNPENPLILVILILTFPAGTDFAQTLRYGIMALPTSE